MSQNFTLRHLKYFVFIALFDRLVIACVSYKNKSVYFTFILEI